MLMKNRDLNENVRNMIFWIVWYLWKIRNGLIFEGKVFVVMDLIFKIAEEVDFWFLV